MKELVGILADQGVLGQPIGIDIVELPFLFEMQKAGVEVRDAQQTMLDARQIKSPDELMLLSQAAAMVDGVYQDIFVRTDENLEMARLLRRKTATLIAFGSCAATGGIPALSNLHSRAAHFASIYGEGPSLDNAAGRLPSVHTAMPEGDLELPGFHERVKRLEEVVSVDYTIPGCPPEPHQIWNVVRAVVEGAALPPRGSVLGAGKSTVCEECVRPKQEKRMAAFRRNFEVVPDATTCLLEQGMLCMGPATRDGCRALCPRANMPCTGCYGPPEGVRDQGAKMIAALGSVVDFENCRGSDEERLAERIESVCDSLPDAAGTFYRYSLAAPILDRR